MLFFLEEKIYTTDQKLVITSTHTYLSEVRKTHIQYKTLWEWFGRQEGGMAGEVLPPAQKTKKMKSRDHFSYLRD